MARSVDEWIAKHDDQKVPPRVRQRVFDRYEGKCHLTGQVIAPGVPWQLDHIVSLILGGEHRESNLAPALVEPHKAKTKVEKAVKSKIAAVRQKHLGIKAPKQTIQSAGFPKRQREKPPLTKIVPRGTGLYQERSE